jgi:hypothetical protein
MTIWLTQYELPRAVNRFVVYEEEPIDAKLAIILNKVRQAQHLIPHDAKQSNFIRVISYFQIVAPD